ncbi:MAG: hypothetical protein WCN98_07545 [Verrucomicrobiaceae bacterium]
MHSSQIAFWRHQPLDDQHASSLTAATLSFHEQVGGDIVKLTPAGTYQAHAMGLEDEWDNDPLGRRAITFRPVQRPENWLHLDRWSFGMHEENCLEAATDIVSRLPPGTPLLATVFSPMSQAIQLAGAEALSDHAGHAPECVRQGLTAVAERTVRLIRAYLQCGVAGIYYVSQHHVDGMLASPLLEWGDAIDQRILDASEGLALNIMHFHGAPLGKQLPPLPEAWRVHFEAASGNPSADEWMSSRPEPLVLGLPIERLRQGRHHDVRRKTIAQFAYPQASSIPLLAAACVLPLDFPLDLAALWVQTAKEVRS